MLWRKNTQLRFIICSQIKSFLQFTVILDTDYLLWQNISVQRYLVSDRSDLKLCRSLSLRPHTQFSSFFVLPSDLKKSSASGPKNIWIIGEIRVKKFLDPTMFSFSFWLLVLSQGKGKTKGYTKFLNLRCT